MYHKIRIELSYTAVHKKEINAGRQKIKCSIELFHQTHTMTSLIEWEVTCAIVEELCFVSLMLLDDVQKAIYGIIYETHEW